MNQLKDHWNALPPRTRQLATVGGALIGIMLLYSALWLPIQKDLTRLRDDVPRETAQLNTMRAQTPMIKAMRARMSTSSGPLVPAIEQSALTYGVRSYATKIEAEGSNGARITLEQLPFNTLMTWLSDLQAAQGLAVEEASIEAQTAPGVVNAKLRLRTGAP